MTLDKLYFLYGLDTYRLKRRLKEIVKNCGADDFNTTKFDAQESWDQSKFEDALNTVSFFGGNKLVVVKNIFASKEVDPEKFIKSIERFCYSKLDSKSNQVLFRSQIESGTTNEITLIIIEQNKAPDKRTRLFKYLIKNTQAEEFFPLSGVMWQKFAYNEITARALKLDAPAISYITRETEGDGWALVNLLDQLQLYLSIRLPRHLGGGPAVDGSSSEVKEVSGSFTDRGTLADVELFLGHRARGDSFAMLNALSAGQTQIIICQLKDLSSMSEDPLRILGAIVYQFRQLANIKALQEKGMNSYQIVRELKISPFVDQKISSQAKKIKWGTVKEIYNHLYSTDTGIKSGKIEPGAGIEMLVYNLLQINRIQTSKIKV